MYSFMRHFGSALGVGIGGTTFQNVMALKLDWYGLPKELAKNAEGYITLFHAMPASEQKTQILKSYVFGFQGVYYAYLAVSAVALLLSLVIKHYDMNKELRTEHQLQRVNNRFSRLVSGATTTNNHTTEAPALESVPELEPCKTVGTSDVDSTAAKARQESTYSGSTTALATPAAEEDLVVEVPKPVLSAADVGDVLKEKEKTGPSASTQEVPPTPSPSN